MFDYEARIKELEAKLEASNTIAKDALTVLNAVAEDLARLGDLALIKKFVSDRLELIEKELK